MLLLFGEDYMTPLQVTSKAIKKAQQSICKHKIAAIAFDKKGNILGLSNNHPKINTPKGGDHAEQRLIRRYGSNIKTILIYRVNPSGNLLPIDPCSKCRKIANKYNIDIKSVEG